MVYMVNLQLYTAVGDRKSDLRIFFQLFMLNIGFFKFDFTQNMAYST